MAVGQRLQKLVAQDWLFVNPATATVQSPTAAATAVAAAALAAAGCAAVSNLTVAAAAVDAMASMLVESLKPWVIPVATAAASVNLAADLLRDPAVSAEPSLRLYRTVLAPATDARQN